jgi:ribonuclease P protein component
VIVPKHGHRIVDRNLLKRRLREVLRTDILPVLGRRDMAVDVLVRARREAYRARFVDLRAELVEWAETRWSPAR